MLNDPILASRTFAPGAFDGNRHPVAFSVNGGLHYIKGNSEPYFSLTYDARGRDCDSGGAGHEKILKYYPQFSDLAALHLCDMDGAPMHAEGNGWYDLAGAAGEAYLFLGQRYHVGNSERHFPRTEIDPAKPWQTTEYRKPTQAECLAIFAQHCRIGLEQAEAIRLQVLAELGPGSDHYDVSQRWNETDFARARARWAEIMETFRPRWKQEAQACIAKHRLVVYGDKWERAA